MFKSTILKGIIGFLLFAICFGTVVTFVSSDVNAATRSSSRDNSPEAKLERLKSIFGDDFTKALERAKEKAEDVVSSGKAKYFSDVLEGLNSANSKITEIKEKIVGWDVEGPAADAYVAELNAQYQSAFTDIFTRCEPILVDGLSQKTAPKDVYKASDKAKYYKMIMADWKAAWPNDKILGLRFPTAGFKQTYNEKTWNDSSNSWRWVKKSALLAEIIVQITPKIAAIYPAYINRDDITHEINTGVYTKGSEYVVELMLVSNFK